MMKLSKKIMLFEEFTQTQTEVKTDVKVNSTSQATTQDSRANDSIRTDIVSDVDSIITKLEDLARGIGQEETNESEIINEGFVDTILSAELYMIPIIAAGAVGTAGLAAGVGATVLIKNIIMKKKIRSKYKKTVLKNKMDAAKMELYVKELRDYKKQDFDEKSKKKIEEFKKKIEALKTSADEMNDALKQKYEKYSDFISNLNSETRMQIAEMMLASKALTDSEKEKYKQAYDNSVRALNNRMKKAEEEKKKAEEAAKNATEEQKKEMEAKREEITKQIEDSQKEETSDAKAELVQVGDERKN